MSPEQQKIVIFSGNRHTSDGSAAGSDVRSRGGVPETVRLIEPAKYQDTQRIMDGVGDDGLLLGCVEGGLCAWSVACYACEKGRDMLVPGWQMNLGLKEKEGGRVFWERGCE